jgi:hypothetical protein
MHIVAQVLGDIGMRTGLVAQCILNTIEWKFSAPLAVLGPN